MAVTNSCKKFDVVRTPSGFELSDHCRKRKALNAVDPMMKRRKVEAASSASATASASASGWGRLDNYEILNHISSGAHGAVYRARDKRSGEVVAIKAEFGGLTPAAVREIEILRSLRRHPMIIGFKEAAADKSGGLYVIMEYAEYNLLRLVYEKNGLSAFEIKILMQQVLAGVKFLHDSNVMHRDLKPCNILIHSTGVVKICDFGLAKEMDPAAGGWYQPRVGTAWYRAPELMASGEYTEAVDMWSLGCVMAEIMVGRRGGGVVETAYKIVSEGGGSDELLRQFPGAVVITATGLDLLRRLLCLNPKWRITAESALRHPWFKEEESTPTNTSEK